MEFLDNQVIRMVMICLLVACGLDLAGRFLAPKPVAIVENTSTTETKTYTSSNITDGQLRNRSNGTNNDTFYLEDNVLGTSQEILDLKILACNSCGYANKATELKDHVEKFFPNAIVTIHEYPKQLTSTVSGYLVRAVQIGLGAVMVGGETIFSKLNMTPPLIYHKLIEKKMIVMMGVIFLGNNLHNFLSNSGAFEVTLGDQTVYSKISSGQLPQIDYVIHRLFELTKNN